LAEAAGQEDSIDEADIEAAEGPVVESDSKWCCLYRVISLQEDFINEKPMIQHFLEAVRGSVGPILNIIPACRTRRFCGRLSTTSLLILPVDVLEIRE
jgi:hypothetical protein